MNIHEWYVTFKAPSLESPLTILGHVMLCGYAFDETSTTWMFFDPAWKGAQIELLYKHDEVQNAIASMFSRGTVLRIANSGNRIAPIWPTMNCATIVAHMIGYRAFTPRGLKRQLLRNGAEVIGHGRRRRRIGTVEETAD